MHINKERTSMNWQTSQSHNMLWQSQQKNHNTGRQSLIISITHEKETNKINQSKAVVIRKAFINTPKYEVSRCMWMTCTYWCNVIVVNKQIMHLTAPHRTSPHRTAPHLTAPHLTARSWHSKHCINIVIYISANKVYVMYTTCISHFHISHFHTRSFPVDRLFLIEHQPYYSSLELSINRTIACCNWVSTVL